MRAGAFSTPRSVPARLLPVAAGGLVVALALPVVLLGGWRVHGWARGAVLWLAAQALGALLARLPLGADNLAAAGMAGIGMMFRPVAVMLVAIAIAARDVELGVSAAVLYALAFSLELAVSLVLYFSGGRAS